MSTPPTDASKAAFGGGALTGEGGRGVGVCGPSLVGGGEAFFAAGGDGARVGGAKRTLDLLLVGLGLIPSLPLWSLVSLAIKLEDGGPIFYSQLRMGRKGKVFRVLKFRSMVPDAERETGAVLASVNDNRVTRVGRLLRATALDELPQLWNIFKGEMSFVGPRPERPDLVSRFRREVPGYDRRFVVRPGLTGLAQVYGKYDSHPREKLRYDLLYIRRGRLWLDLHLIIMSVWISATGGWNSRQRRSLSGCRCRRRARGWIR
jgi:lipopolysaccharide/colanic/teichoic acid biosynthesis glycosyltransferase